MSCSQRTWVIWMLTWIVAWLDAVDLYVLILDIWTTELVRYTLAVTRHLHWPTSIPRFEAVLPDVCCKEQRMDLQPTQNSEILSEDLERCVSDSMVNLQPLGVYRGCKAHLGFWLTRMFHCGWCKESWPCCRSQRLPIFIEPFSFDF